MRLITALLFTFLLLQSSAQLPANIQFTNYTRANGLPEESVNNIIQDSRGFLWLGTREGLIRFDGEHFKTWYADPADNSRFGSNAISIVGECIPGQVFFISGSSLWQVDIRNHQFSQPASFQKKTVLAAPQQLADGNWCICDLDSLYISDARFRKLYSLSINPYYPPGTFIATFSLQYPYILLYSRGIQRYTLFNYLNRSFTPLSINDSLLDSRSKFFLPTAYDSSIHRLYMSAYFNGNFSIDLKLPGITRYTPEKLLAQQDGAIRKSILLPGNRMIQGGDNGLYITDIHNSSVAFNSTTKMDKPMLANAVLDICNSRDGYFWLATTDGISRFTLAPPPVHYWRRELQLGNTGEFKSIIKGPDGNIYLLTEAGSLSRFDPAAGKITPLDKKLNYCWSAIQTGKEILFTGAGQKIGAYNMETGKTTYPHYLEPFYTPNTDVVTLVFRAKNGDIWYSCNGGGGLIRNPAGTSQYIQYSRSSSPPAFSHSYVHTAAEDKNGNIWWGSNKTEMLLKWDNSKQHFYEYGIDELSGQRKLKTGINNLFIDTADNLWVALDGASMVRYNLRTQTSSFFDINKGLPTDAVNSICNDAHNRLWFGTRKGLCCYLPDKDKIITFTAYDGLPDDNFEGNGIFYDPVQNILYAGVNKSVAYFNPDSLLSQAISARPSVFIDEMLVNGKVFYFGDEKHISLSTHENNIEFGFASPDYSRNNQLLYQYQLTGVSKDWIDLGDKRSVTFNNLRYGTYTLSVRCKYKGTDTWAETTIPFTFTIRTPWHQTWWFRLLLAVLVSFVIWLVVRNYYRRKLEKQKTVAEKIQAVEKERTRIATDMHDDFGASLSRIKFISEKMQLTEEQNETLRKDLTKISEYSDEMAEKMNEIVWALNQRFDSCADLVSFCRAYASEYLSDKNIRFLFRSGDIPDMKIQGEVRRNIFLVIKEALHNIVKHAGATETHIAFDFNDRIHVAITDNGKGFRPDGIRPFANGLENMKKRISDIGGNINITGANGTSINLSVPL